jgi:hypothetical protein
VPSAATRRSLLTLQGSRTRMSLAARRPMTQAPPIDPSQREARRAPPLGRAVTGKASHDGVAALKPSGRRQGAPRCHHHKHLPDRQVATTSVVAQPDEEESHHRRTREPRPRASNMDVGGRKLRRKAPPSPS